MKQILNVPTLLLSTAVLAACGAGSGGGSLAGGGIGGTGSGSITGIGSIFLNGGGKFETDNAKISIDGESVSESDLNVGMTVGLDYSQGVAQQVRVLHQVKGPITSLAPLTVLGQTVVVTGDTLIEDDSPHPSVSVSFGSLIVGNELEVSGPVDEQDVIQASRLEFKDEGLNRWQLVGRVQGLLGSRFSIGAQAVDFGVISPSNCGTGLSEGDRVVVKADPGDPTSFSAVDTLTQVTDVECIPDRLGVTGAATVIEGEFEGFVTEAPVTSGGLIQFEVGEQEVVFNPGTVAFEGGTLEDIQLGAKLNVRGDFNTNTGLLKVDRIRFRETRVRLQGPATLLAMDSVELLGLTVLITAQTEVEGGLTSGDQVRINGFIDNSGTLFASEVKDKGGSDPDDVRVRGPVDKDSINATDQTFSLFDITVERGVDADYFIEDQPATAETFFAALREGNEVSVEAATFNSGTNSLSSAVIELEIGD
ncbi:MAG: DUF5666 domain-containing protein [Motiliproteus sp.]